MSLEDLGNIGELVAAVAVVISLLYLAVQIKGDARAKRAAMTHAQAQANAGFASILATRPEVTELYLRGIHDYESLRGAELIQFSGLMIHLFRLYEDQFLQWIDGDLDPQVWHGIDAVIDDFCSLPGPQAWWRARSHWFAERFQMLVEKKISEQGAAAALYGDGHL